MSLLLDAKGPPLFEDQGPLDWVPEEHWAPSCTAALGPPIVHEQGPVSNSRPPPANNNTSARARNTKGPPRSGAQAPPLGAPVHGTLLGVGEHGGGVGGGVHDAMLEVPPRSSGGVGVGEDGDDEGDKGDAVQRVLTAAYRAVQGNAGGGAHGDGCGHVPSVSHAQQQQQPQAQKHHATRMVDDDDVLSIVDSDDDTESSAMEGFDLEEDLDFSTGTLTMAYWLMHMLCACFWHWSPCLERFCRPCVDHVLTMQAHAVDHM